MQFWIVKQNYTMNKIEALLDPKEHYPILKLKVDDKWLDELLDEYAPNRQLKGLIPTLCFRMERDIENQIVWERILPNTNEKRIAPILMCPDDLDFSCTIVTVECAAKKDYVEWKNFALDITPNTYQNPLFIGRNSSFLTHPQLKFQFRRSEYKNVVKQFQEQYTIENDAWNEKNPNITYPLPF